MSDFRVQLAHLSDLHFGAASSAAIDALHDDLAKRDPEMVVITGDLTQAGRKKEFEEAREFLSNLKAKTFIVPGNHDLPVRNLWARFVAPYNRFQRYISDSINPVWTDNRFALIGLNSARRAALGVNWSYGRLSRRQIDDAITQLQNADAACIKIIAAHHPFIRGPGKAGARIVKRGGEAMSEFACNGLDIILTGHVHLSKAEIIATGSRNIIVIQAGTAVSGRTRGEPPSFNVIAASPSCVEVEAVTLREKLFRSAKKNSFVRADEGGWIADSATPK